MTIAILGAGAIGIAIGAQWGATLIGRERVLAPIRRDGLRLTGGGWDRRVPADAIRIGGPDDLETAGLVVLTTKSTALPAAMELLAERTPQDTPILSLMNGLAPIRDLRTALPNPILRGVVQFNIVWRAPTHLHRSSTGRVAVEAHPMTKALTGVEQREDLKALQHGKLLLNLVNPLNALSGQPLRAMLSDRAWRRLYAATLAEAIAVYDQVGIAFAKAGPVPPRLAPALLRLPDAIFVPTLLRLQRIDATSMTSMATDLAKGRPTEIGILNGEIVRLAPDAAPINDGLVRLIRKVERDGPRRYNAFELSSALRIRPER